MKKNESFQHVVVLGAAGKMGTGISLILLQEMAYMEGTFLILLDSNEQGFAPLRSYLREHLTKHAERSINKLRERYAARLDLVDNIEIIEEFVTSALDRVRCVTALEECREAQYIFEAIIEDVEVKVDMLRKLDECTGKKAYYFTNTSSIPLSVLQEKSGVAGRIIGYHFYNPPAVQKLLEIIIPNKIEPQLYEVAIELARNLKKTVIIANDVAGFIGNGHFIREIIVGCHQVREFAQTMSSTEALYTVDKATQELLLRPMGIFQLIDYCGIDVCQRIATIMTNFLPGSSFIDPLIDAMVAAGVRGGQHPDGSQKNGFFQYERGIITGVFDIDRKVYVSCPKVNLWTLPAGYISWKELSKDSQRKEKIAGYFQNLWKEPSMAEEFSRMFLRRSQGIAHALVKDRVARSIEDVDTVLKLGFYHIYGVD